MKNITRLLILITFVLLSNILNAQPPHPNGGKVPAPGIGGNAPVGGGAPIGSGNLILFLLAVAYAGRKVYQLKPEAESD